MVSYNEDNKLKPISLKINGDRIEPINERISVMRLYYVHVEIFSFNFWNLWSIFLFHYIIEVALHHEFRSTTRYFKLKYIDNGSPILVMENIIP